MCGYYEIQVFYFGTEMFESFHLTVCFFFRFVVSMCPWQRVISVVEKSHVVSFNCSEMAAEVSFSDILIQKIRFRMTDVLSELSQVYIFIFCITSAELISVLLSKSIFEG